VYIVYNLYPARVLAFERGGLMTVEIINSRDARAKWRDLLDKVFSGVADIVIERNGKPVAVLISVEDYEELQDELEELRAARRAAAIYESWKRDPSSGRSLEDVGADLKADGVFDG
jgi:prevent-host-death family protein